MQIKNTTNNQHEQNGGTVGEAPQKNLPCVDLIPEIWQCYLVLTLPHGEKRLGTPNTSSETPSWHLPCKVEVLPS